jgi:phage tail sheath gpL-like
MSGDFSEFPDAVRLPFSYVEFDPSLADRGLSSNAFNVLLPGQMLPAGSAEPLTPKTVTSEAQACEYFGQGSQLAQMIAAYLKANKLTRLTAVGVLDYAGGTAAAGSVEFTGAVTRPVPICLYIGGILVRAGVTANDSAESVAAKVTAAVNALPSLPVTAVQGSDGSESAVYLTARHKGECGNEIDLRFSYLEEDFPVGLTYAVTPMAGGAGNPDPGGLVAAMGTERYHLIALPWTDTASLNALSEELESRWGPLRQTDGQAVIVKTGTFAEVTSFTRTRNDKNLTVLPNEGSPTLPWADCAASAAVLAYFGADDPARPFQTLTIPGVQAPRIQSRWPNFPEKNQALSEGCSVRDVTPSGDVMFLDVITTHRVNSLGAETQAYNSLNSVLTLSYLRYDWNNLIRTKYPRHKLADDEVAQKINPGQAVMTPKLMKSEAVARMHLWMQQGLVEAPEDFASKLRAERDPDNPNRLNIVMSPDLVNQFKVSATLIQFLL